MSNKTYVFLALLILVGGFIYFSKIQKTTVVPTVEKIVNPEPSKPDSHVETFTLNFVGDIMPARAIERTMRANGYDYPFLKIKEELADADVTFANLESPLIGDRDTGRTTSSGVMVFRGDVDFAVALKNAGIDIVSLANNHMGDQGSKGIDSTLKVLAEAKVKGVGVGMNLNEARAMAIVEIPSKSDPRSAPFKVGFLAYNDSDVVPESYHATIDRAGSNIMNNTQLIEDIKLNRDKVDVLIVSMHAGNEYTKKESKRQYEFAHLALSSGADMVIGHHPHVLQPIEAYKGKYIFYSLGNFIFDQIKPDTKQSVLVRMNIQAKREGDKWTDLSYRPFVLPLVIDQFQPQPLTDKGSDQYKNTLNRFQFPYSFLTIKDGSGKGQTLLVDQATTSEDRQTGLSGTHELSKRQGLLFVFEATGKHGIWMKDMNFPIDILWFDSQFKLVNKELSVATSTYPHVFYPSSPAKYVLETGVGELADLSLTDNLTGELTGIDSYDKK